MIAILSSLLLVCTVVHALYIPFLLGMFLPSRSENGLKPMTQWLIVKPYIAGPIWLYILAIISYPSYASPIAIRNAVITILPFLGISLAIVISYWNVVCQNRWAWFLLFLDFLHLIPLFLFYLALTANAGGELLLMIAIFYPMFFATTASIIVRETPAPAPLPKPKRRKKSPQLLLLSDGELFEIVEAEEQT